MFSLIVIGTGLSIGIIRCVLYKKSNKSKKIRYYNYSKFAVKYKKVNNAINEQSKSL